jgi:hypothetical protein
LVEILVETNLVIDGVERASLDFDENIMRSSEGGDWNVDELKDTRVTWSLEGNGFHRFRS